MNKSILRTSMWINIWASMRASLLVICTSGFAQTLPIALPVALPDSSPAAIWRATSRLGYGPTPALMQAAQPSAKAWSLAQLDAARQASQRPPQIPSALQALAATQAQVSARFHEEREARKENRTNVQKPNPPIAAMQGDGGMGLNSSLNSSLGNDPENYSRDMAQAAGAWRMASCSNPEMENPLLARMTEFWFNHFNVFIGKGPVRPFVGNYLMSDGVGP